MEQEQWKPVDSWYSVSDHGKVYSWHGSGRYLAQHLCRYGYPRIRLASTGSSPTHVHALVAKAFLGQRPDGMVVDHIDENRANNRIENIRYLDNYKNISRSRDYRKDSAKGEGHGRAKLANDHVYWIRASGLTDKVKADWLNVSEPTVQYARTGKTWRHL
jgi:hypothetical protein